MKGIILKRTTVKKDGSSQDMSLPVSVRTDHGFTQYFYSPQGFWINACDLNKPFRQFDGSVITWSIEQ
ncbi:hypothetical protein KYLE_17 [Pantoea phage Kyle]|uniref:Uncharacterized protein n=1 Tax=Pantoea phage Kyle TaxID=2589665 RepID=A0A514A8N5_9CAUD|nr:hypothetical protein HWC52_gp017 [Pantoea phage Kyle]QDH49638.1 hypothetical protein KYLE_17 [Pantoea phage Kyle]